MSQIYKPGEECDKSGIYKVVHDDVHKGIVHEVTVVHGEHFPPCNGCGHHPRFELVKAAIHFKWHDYFKKK